MQKGRYQGGASWPVRQLLMRVGRTSMAKNGVQPVIVHDLRSEAQSWRPGVRPRVASRCVSRAFRTRAIAVAIRTGLANHEGPDIIEARIRAGRSRRITLTLW